MFGHAHNIGDVMQMKADAVKLESDDTEAQWEANKTAHWESNEWAANQVRWVMFEIIKDLNEEGYATHWGQLDDVKLAGQMADVMERTINAKRDMQQLLLQMKKRLEFSEPKTAAKKSKKRDA